MENKILGKCCICEQENETVRSIITLDVKTLDTESRGGWGCVVCGLDARGAVAVLCDGCADEWQAKQTPIKFACLGYPGANRRIEVEKLTEVWEHNPTKHPESWNWEKALAHSAKSAVNISSLPESRALIRRSRCRRFFSRLPKDITRASGREICIWKC